MKSHLNLFLGPLVLVSTSLFAADPVRLGQTQDARGLVGFTVPLSKDEGNLEATFDFGHTKGFLGPSSNPSDQSGFSNADKTIVAVNHQPVTKSSYVHLFLRSPSGDITFINDVNGRVAGLMKDRWAETAKHFLRVESISGRELTLQTVDSSRASQEKYEFTITVSRDGSISLAK